MEQLIGRPVADDRVLDLSFCIEMGAAGMPQRPRTPLALQASRQGARVTG
jgi:hypothetical protein